MGVFDDFREIADGLVVDAEEEGDGWVMAQGSCLLSGFAPIGAPLLCVAKESRQKRRPHGKGPAGCPHAGKYGRARRRTRPRGLDSGLAFSARACLCSASPKGRKGGAPLIGNACGAHHGTAGWVRRCDSNPDSPRGKWSLRRQRSRKTNECRASIKYQRKSSGNAIHRP